MKETNPSIMCDVQDCRHYKKKCCTKDKIKVAPCAPNEKSADGKKEATMCDSYDSK